MPRGRLPRTNVYAFKRATQARRLLSQGYEAACGPGGLRPIEDLARAVALAGRFSRDEPEPGPYYVIEVPPGGGGKLRGTEFHALGSTAIGVNGNVRMLDEAGNDKAMTAFKAGNLKLGKNGGMRVTIDGYRHGNTIQVEGIPRARLRSFGALTPTFSVHRLPIRNGGRGSFLRRGFLSGGRRYGIAGGLSGNQPRAAGEGQILEAPLHKDHHAVLKLHQIHQVDEEPHQPGRQSRKVQAEDARHGGTAADYRQIALIEIVEGRQIAGAVQAFDDGARGVRSALHSHLRHAG